MNIAQICFSGLGGHSSVVFSLISADIKKNNYWLVGFVGNEPVSDQNLSQCLKHSVDYSYFLYKKPKRIYVWVQLFRWLQKSKPRYIICHSSSMIFPCFLYSKIYSARLVSVEHTPNSQKKTFEWIFGFLSMLLSSKVIILTHSYLKEIQKAYKNFYLSSRFTIVPNGIDTNVFKLSNSKPLSIHQKDEIILGMAARFSSQKKQDFLIELVESLNHSQSRYRFILKLAGDGETMKKCQILVQNKAINSSVIFSGFLEERELVDWFEGIDIYLHATDGETLSTSILQAMSCEVPIIASDIPGVTNLLKQEKVFGITSKNTILEFSNNIINLLSDPNTIKDITKNAREKVLSDYSNLEMLKKYITSFIH